MTKERNVEGILNGLANLVDRLGELAEKGERLKRSGDFQVGPDGRGRWNVGVRVGSADSAGTAAPSGAPSAQPRPERPAREPLIDCFDEGDGVLVVAEMPGVGIDDIAVRVEGRTLALSAETRTQRWAARCELPTACVGAPTIACNNGVVELRFTKAT